MKLPDEHILIQGDQHFREEVIAELLATIMLNDTELLIPSTQDVGAFLVNPTPKHSTTYLLIDGQTFHNINHSTLIELLEDGEDYNIRIVISTATVLSGNPNHRFVKKLVDTCKKIYPDDYPDAA